MVTEPSAVPTKKKAPARKRSDLKAAIDSLKATVKHDSLFIKKALVTIDENVKKSRADLGERIQGLHEKYTAVKKELQDHAEKLRAHDEVHEKHSELHEEHAEKFIEIERRLETIEGNGDG